MTSPNPKKKSAKKKISSKAKKPSMGATAAADFSDGDRVEYVGDNTPTLTKRDRGNIRDQNAATRAWVHVRWDDGHSEPAHRDTLIRI